MKLMHPFKSYGSETKKCDKADADMIPMCEPCLAGET